MGKVGKEILDKMAISVAFKWTGLYNILLSPLPLNRTGKLPLSFPPCVYWTKICTQRLTCSTQISPEAGCSIQFRDLGHTTHIHKNRSNVSNKLLIKLKSTFFRYFYWFWQEKLSWNYDFNNSCTKYIGFLLLNSVQLSLLSENLN
jgi:hypothetical protein